MIILLGIAFLYSALYCQPKCFSNIKQQLQKAENLYYVVIGLKKSLAFELERPGFKVLGINFYFVALSKLLKVSEPLLFF